LTVHCFLQAVTKSIVGIGGRAIYGCQSIGGIIGIGVDSVSEQVAVGIEGVGLCAYGGESIGGIVVIINCRRYAIAQAVLGQAVERNKGRGKVRPKSYKPATEEQEKMFNSTLEKRLPTGG